jgi:hypothetical protein
MDTRALSTWHRGSATVAYKLSLQRTPLYALRVVRANCHRNARLRARCELCCPNTGQERHATLAPLRKMNFTSGGGAHGVLSDPRPDRGTTSRGGAARPASCQNLANSNVALPCPACLGTARVSRRHLCEGSCASRGSGCARSASRAGRNRQGVQLATTRPHRHPANSASHQRGDRKQTRVESACSAT